MEAEIAELEKTGATEIAAKLREAWKAHQTAHDTLKGEHAAATSKLSQSEKALAKATKDLEASGKTVDERVAALTKERDTLSADRDAHKQLAEESAANFDRFKLRTAVQDEYFGGISDKVTRKRAVDAFLADYLAEGAGFDDKGKLQGFDASVEAFKKAETWAFPPPEVKPPGNGGNRSGSDTGPKVSDKPNGAESNALLREIYPNDFKQKGA